MNFDDGKAGEGFVGGVFERHGFSFKSNSARSVAEKKLWDLEVRVGASRPVRLEVKFDRKERETGNVAVEYWNTNSDTPSGLFITRADLWVFVLEGVGGEKSSWACPVRALRAYVASVPCEKDIKRGGDGNAAMRLYRRDVIFPAVFRRFDSLPKAELKTLFLELFGR